MAFNAAVLTAFDTVFGMAKRKTAQTIRIVDAPQEVLIDETDDTDTDELRALAEIDGSQEVRWSVYRTVGIPGQDPGWVGSFNSGELTMEHLAAELGKGRYRVRGTRSDGTFAGQKTLTISYVPKALQKNSSPIDGSAPASSSSQDLLTLLESRDAARNDSMLKWAAILTPLFAPVISNMFAGSKGPTLEELTTSLKNIKDLSGTQSQLTQMEQFGKMVALVKDISSEGSEKTGSTWVDLIRDGVKELSPAITAIASRGMPSAPPPVVPQTEVLPPPTPPMQGDPMLAWLKSQLEALTFQASMNKDSTLYAEVVIDNIPPGLDPALLKNYLSQENWWALISSFSPGVSPYKQWFAECRAAMLRDLEELLTPPPPAEVTPIKKPAKGKV